MAKRNRYFEDEVLVDKFNSKMLLRSVRYLRPYRSTLIKMSVAMAIMSLVALLPPMLNRLLIDNVLNSDNGLFGLSLINTAILIMSAWALLSLSDVVYVFFRSRVMAKFGYNIIHDIRRDTFYNLQRLAFDYFDSRPAGKILIRVTSYIDELANIFTSAVVTIIVEGIKITLAIAMLFVLEWRLALVVLAVIIPMAATLFFMQGAIRKRHRVGRNKNANRTAYIAENINGIAVTKAFNRTEYNTQVYADLCLQSNRAGYRTVRLNELFFPVIDGFWHTAIIAVYAVTLMLSLSTGSVADISLGVFSSFTLYMSMVAGPLNNIANIFQQLASATSNLERVLETAETQGSVSDAENAYDMPEVTGAVQFNSVTFAYEKGHNILENFNLAVEPGKCVALVGPTGAGKSTVVNLLSRFYNVNEGSITIDGHDISKVTLTSLRQQVGVMMQDSFIFSGSIIDNIRYARPSATDDECIEAAKAASAHDFISALQHGYYTVTAEQGAGLSTGQRQLLSFARVILTDPKILILDEATSSIDTATEENIQSALAEILKGRTSFIIAHRLSTIKRADCILYISDKGIAEAGTHEALMQKKGKYYSLVTRGAKAGEKN